VLFTISDGIENKFERLFVYLMQYAEVGVKLDFLYAAVISA
jgi:hypothetical protein